MDPTSCSSVGCDSCRLILCIGSDFRPADGGLRLPVESSEELDPALSAGESGTPMVTSLSSLSYVVAADNIFSRLLLVACEYNEAPQNGFSRCVDSLSFQFPSSVSRQTIMCKPTSHYFFLSQGNLHTSSWSNPRTPPPKTVGRLIYHTILLRN